MLIGLIFMLRLISFEEMTHRCDFIQEGFFDEEHSSSYHVPQLFLGGGGRDLQKLLIHRKQGVHSVTPGFRIYPCHLGVNGSRFTKRMRIYILVTLVL